MHVQFYFRKILIGGLNFPILKSFIPTFYEEAVVLNEKLRSNIDLKSKDCRIFGPISNATMEMIGQTAFGIKFNSQNEMHNHRFVENLQIILRVCITSTTLINNCLYLLVFIGLYIFISTLGPVFQYLLK